MKVKMNELPVITWRYLKVNHDEVTLYRDLPKVESQVTLEGDQNAFVPMTAELAQQYETSFEDLQTGIDALWFKEHHETLSNGYFITGEHEKENPLTVHYTAPQGMLSDHNVIVAEEGQHICVIFRYQDPLEYLSSLTRVIAKKGSVVDIVKIHDTPNMVEGTDVITGLVEEDAQVNIISVELGGKHALTNYHLELLGDHSVGTIKTIYVGKEEEVLDLAYRINHYGKENLSHILSNGILHDHAKKTFKGTLDFKTGSSGSKGAESETTTLLSETVRSSSIPTLLCSEDDVEGDHAASAGRLDESLLFYLMSRGYDEQESREILIFAQLTPTIEEIPHEEIRAGIYRSLETIMGANKG